MHVSILLPRGECIASSIIGPAELLGFVNQHLLESGQTTEPFYNVDFVGIDEESLNVLGGVASIHPTKTIGSLTQTDLVIVTTIHGDVALEIEKNLEFLPWIRRMHTEENAEVASLCMGAFMLAATGLVNGKTCTTHWTASDLFRKMYPEVVLLPEEIISEDKGVYSSGGSYSYLNLMLYLIQKYNGRDVAKLVAKVFAIDIERSSQAQFIIFQGQKNHEDQIIIEVQEYLEKNFHADILLEDLANEFHISTRSLIRRFKKATYNTPNQYLQRVKIEVAKRKLEDGGEPISQIMYESGYADAKYFRKVFKKLVGLSPQQYRQKYRRMVEVQAN